MADLKISQLSDGGASQATDEYVVARSGSNFRIDGASVAAAATSVGTLTSLTVSGTTTLASSSGNVGIGVTPSVPLHVKAASNEIMRLQSSDATTGSLYFTFYDSADAEKAYIGYGSGANDDFLFVNRENAAMAFFTNATERARIDASGNLAVDTNTLYVDAANNRVGIGTASPSVALDVSGDIRAVTQGITRYITAGSDTQGAVFVQRAQASWGDVLQTYRANVLKWALQEDSGAFVVNVNSAERMRLDASGNLGLGATNLTGKLTVRQSTDATNGGIVIEATNGDGCVISRLTDGGMTFRNGGVERARITSDGRFLVAKTSSDTTATGCELQSGSGGDAAGLFTASGGTPVIVNRQAEDGTLVSLRQANTEEGTISVSGNTVSYNAFAGSHWSQLEDGSKPEILRGTIIEAIDELCEWPGEQNERLPKCKVSDTAGSKKVYGVFMAWDNDWTATNDLYVTALGAFICRISANVTVEQGDLLESNGDGTARVQADDVIRSSTIGKVTSTVQTHQYEDGTYCVPVVLYCG